jgi:hypothetical protein
MLPDVRHLAAGFAIVLGLTLSAACGAPAPMPAPAATSTPRASAWPAADRIFHVDAHWLGGDAAVSIALDAERVLWLFGDSFVDDGVDPSRARARFVRNSVALQHGRDPQRAEMAFYARRTGDGGAGSFFPEQDGAWFWPGHGVYDAGELTIFLERMRADAAPGGLGFRSAGWSALRVHDARGEPDTWQLEPLPVPDTGALGLVGVAVLLEADGVYAYGVREPGDHAIALLRWSRADFARGDLLDPEFFLGPGGGFGRGAPATVMDDGATEFSVTRAADGGYLEVQSHGFGAAPIALRRAPALAGPWSALRDAYRPEEANRSGVLLYAARAHPELEAGGDLAVTYASNALDPAAVTGDLSLYFPRFVRLIP